MGVLAVQANHSPFCTLWADLQLQGSWMFRPSPFPGGCGRVVLFKKMAMVVKCKSQSLWAEDSSVCFYTKYIYLLEAAETSPTYTQTRATLARLHRTRRSESWTLVALELVTTRRQGKNLVFQRSISINWRVEVDLPSSVGIHSQVCSAWSELSCVNKQLQSILFLHQRQYISAWWTSKVCLNIFFRLIFLTVFQVYTIFRWVGWSRVEAQMELRWTVPTVGSCWKDLAEWKDSPELFLPLLREAKGGCRVVQSAWKYTTYLGLKLSMKLNWIDCRFQTFVYLREITSS